MAKFLAGESRPDRKTASRVSITKLPAAAAELPPLGSPEDLSMRAMQTEARSLIGGLGHLARGRIDVTVDHALLAQHMHRPTYETFEHAKEVLRFAWSSEDASMVHENLSVDAICGDKPDEPIRPYDDDVERGLYGMSDATHTTPAETVAGSKSMGAYAVMLGGAAIEWKSWRHHTLTTDVTSSETLSASRLAPRLIYFTSLMRFMGMPPPRPPPLFTDNDGTWYVSKDATSATRQTYIIRHVRFLQQAVEMEHVGTFQVDGRLNPVDALSKWLEVAERIRHYLFLMGQPAKALQVWRDSKAFKQYKPKRIVPVPTMKLSYKLKGDGAKDKNRFSVLGSDDFE